jgi:acyl carrier protein
MTNTDRLDERIKLVFAETFQIAPELIADETRRGAFECWDSLGHLDLIEALNNEFAVEIPPEQALDMETVADIKRVIDDLNPGE